MFSIKNANFFINLVKNGSNRIGVSTFNSNEAIGSHKYSKIVQINQISSQFHSQTVKNESKNTEDDRETHFGFQKIKESEKTQEVFSVFKNVADKYDLMNDTLSLGIHRIWKDIFMSRLNPTEGTKLLDCAGGTGDIAFRFLNHIKNSNSSLGSHVTVCDINPNMLEVGKVRFRELDCDPSLISWQEANAETLPFEDEQFDAYTIAFGIRNVTRIDLALQEAYRVLKPGGRFLCLEFSHLNNDFSQWMYDQYSFQLIPVMGQILSGQWQAYQYLVESIRQFPNQDKFKNIIEEAGFRSVTYENLTLGMVAIHSGFKL